jgi:hypothetical protein
MMKREKTENPPAKTDSPFEKSLARVSTPANFKTIKRLTRDVTSITRLGEVILLLQSGLYEIEMDDPAKPGQKRPVAAVDCMDCLTGDEFVLICGAVLHSTWKRFNGDLAGNYFAVRSGDIAPGKHYRKVDVVHLERVE